MEKILSLAFASLFVLSATGSGATTVTENVATTRLLNGWEIFGDTNLFQWDSTNQNLDVTWNSSRSDSYFHRPLGTILGTDDDFSVEFDLRLSGAAPGNFEVAVGLLNLSDATSTIFSRLIGSTPNLFEFDYFPDGGSLLAHGDTAQGNGTIFFLPDTNTPTGKGSYRVRAKRP